ncbi:hypothetical protein DRP04_10865, partial [Archaeoglobales archaeon]
MLKLKWVLNEKPLITGIFLICYSMPRKARIPLELYKLIKKERMPFSELWKEARGRKIGHDKFYELLEELEYAGCVVVRKEGRNKEIIKIIPEIDGWEWKPDELRRVAAKEL